jgi:hypothetical protein
MSGQRLLFYYLWIAPHILLVAVAALMVRRKLQREFPYFFAYVVFEVLQFALIFTLFHSKSASATTYQYSFLACDAISMGLRFAVTNEVFAHMFREYPALRDIGSTALRWTAVILILVGVGMAAYSSNPGLNWVTQVLFIPQRALFVLQLGLLVLLFVFSGHFGISWRNYIFGIALGLGLWAAFELVIVAVRMEFGPNYKAELFHSLDSAVYHCAVLVWLGYLLAPESAGRAVPVLPQHDMDKWKDELERLLQR